MKKLKLIKVVVPETVAYVGPGPDRSNMRLGYQCTECRSGIAKGYAYCPYCGSELDWDNERKPPAEILELINRL